MPVSNFWIDCDIDGRETKLEGGPAAKDGGFRLDLTVLDKGRIVKGLVVEGEALGDNLTLRVWGHKGKELIYAHCTVR